MTAVVYLISNEKNRSYVGITGNINRRLKEHNNGRGARYTKKGTWHVILTVNNLTRQQAAQLEYKIKRTSLTKKESTCNPIYNRVCKISKALRSKRWTKKATPTACLDIQVTLHHHCISKYVSVPTYVEVVPSYQQKGCVLQSEKDSCWDNLFTISRFHQENKKQGVVL
jgi:putative endonuclease